MKIHFNKGKFIEQSQRNLIAPKYGELRKGNVGEWVLAIMFMIIFGIFWYPPIALLNTHITK